MSETAHTPGPWEIAEDDANGQAVVRGEHTEIATCWHHCVGSIETEMRANARLIAAAPDMLDGGTEQTAILRAAQEILTRHLLPDWIDASQAITELLGLLDGPAQRSAQAKWDAAIAKATGVAA